MGPGGAHAERDRARPCAETPVALPRAQTPQGAQNGSPGKPQTRAPRHSPTTRGTAPRTRADQGTAVSDRRGRRGLEVSRSFLVRRGTRRETARTEPEASEKSIGTTRKPPGRSCSFRAIVGNVSSNQGRVSTIKSRFDAGATRRQRISRSTHPPYICISEVTLTGLRGLLLSLGGYALLEPRDGSTQTR